MCYNPISPIKTILCIITKIVFFTWILAMSEPNAVVRCYSIFVLLHSLLQAHWAGVCVSAEHWCQPAWLAWERVPGRNHSAGTAAVFKVLELGRGLSIHHFLVLLSVVTWSCINSWFLQHIFTVAAFAMIHSYSFQSTLVSFYRLRDVFGCLQARICIACARPFIQSYPTGFTYVQMSSIFCFFSKFGTANLKIQISRLSQW